MSATPPLHLPPVAPEGPHFVYEAGPELFLNRRGRGPLKVVWDTNIFVDYLTHGAAMWDGRHIQVDDAEYEAELEALLGFMQLWQLRDIRIRVLERSVTDAKNRLPSAVSRRRQYAVDELADALRYDAWDEPEFREEEAAETKEAPRAIQVLPKGADQELVASAMALGAHVFLTRDKGILKRRDAFRGHGLLLASPLDLLEELTACGAMHCILLPGMAYWPIPDLQRVTHLINVVGYEDP